MMHMYTYMSIVANLSCLMFLLLLFIIYYKKNNINNAENYIYKKMLNSNLVFLLVELSLFLMGIYMNEQIGIFVVFEKLYLYCSLECVLIFIYYIYSISNSRYNDITANKNLYKKFKLLSVIIVIIMFMLPIEHHIEEGYVQYSYGVAPTFMAACSVFAIIFGFINVFANRKTLDKIKIIPLYTFVISMGIFFTIHYFEQSLFLTSLSITLISYLMFFTIENPDAKMLEEVHKAKNISDNANEEKAMFLYNMTNEIRDLIKDIDYSAGIILDETDNKNLNIDTVNHCAREIKGSTAKFTTMTNELLDISQMDSASIKVYNDKYNVKLIIKELVQIYKTRCEEKNITFRTSIASDLPEYLYGDSVGLKHVLNVLLDNSVKYTENGYVEFNVSSIMKNDICRLIITIEDSGKGMKAEEINEMFNTKKDVEEGNNLKHNLINARKLITLMNGTIIPSSIYGSGTTMKIVIDQKVFEEENEITKYENILDKKKILLVDDNASSQKLISKMLSDTNIELDIVSMGKECLDKIRNKEKYDLILLDEQMVPLDGITVMKKLQEIRNFNTKVILLTRNNNYEYNEEYLKYGFCDYLLKPIVKNNIIEKIDKHLK